MLQSLILYTFQFNGGKKPKKGAWNGYAKIYIGKDSANDRYNYGIRHKKCIRTYSDKITQIHGKFVNDTLEGNVKIIFSDKLVPGEVLIPLSIATKSSLNLKLECIANIEIVDN